ncbi:glycosyltransferase family 4 protein [Sphingomonas sp. DG1-23]|uniref:glycosyltransferase family 4 protein n=1 Tax=Sphingomonas sp. DG1-23 TaxID=3068316 RepID=UPI00273DC367|nr:glycosyltransferase family 4 protein [Sphingomonas sp. DG1-23]MDP5280672.1 glycosyltransferase family 4 protein [Sphingomonas sp. DG1-23]
MFLTDNFAPEVNAPASRTFEHCREWAARGHSVTVITGAPNFPAGKVMAGYRNRLWQKEEMEGIEVIRVWTFIARNEGFALRIVDYLSYMITAALAGMFVRRPDVIVATSPQFFTLLAARFLSLARRRPWVLELRDLWPESIKAVDAMGDSIAIRLIERIERYLYRAADRVITVTHTFKSILVSRGVDAQKIDVVTNGVDLTNYTPRDGSALRRRLGLEGKLLIGYVGTHGMAHALETLIEAATLARSDAGLADLHFVLVGEGARKESLMALAAERGLDNISFHPSVPKDQVAEWWAILDAAVVHLKRTELFESVIPSKIFECMAMGVPVLMGVRGEALTIVENAKVGIAFEPENPHALLRQISLIRNDQHLLATLSENGASASVEFDRRRLALRMLEILEKVARA